MDHTKKSLKQDLIDYEFGVIMHGVIISAVEKFRHYKSVNKKFVDYIESLGLCAYICKDKYSTTLRISPDRRKVKDVSGGLEFRVYKSHFSEPNPITWGDIEYDLNRYNWAERVRRTKDRLQVIDAELVRFKKLVEYLKEQSFTCFDIDSLTRELRYKIEKAEKEGQ